MLTIDPDALRDNAAQASQLLKALSHPDRLMLLCRLAEGLLNRGRQPVEEVLVGRDPAEIHRADADAGQFRSDLEEDFFL